MESEYLLAAGVPAVASHLRLRATIAGVNSAKVGCALVAYRARGGERPIDVYDPSFHNGGPRVAAWINATTERCAGNRQQQRHEHCTRDGSRASLSPQLRDEPSDHFDGVYVRVSRTAAHTRQHHCVFSSSFISDLSVISLSNLPM